MTDKPRIFVQVSELYPKEKDGDDELGDLWLVKYDDGDSEHMDLKEVGGWAHGARSGP